MLSKYSPGIVACSSVPAPNTCKGQDTFILFSQSCNNTMHAGSRAAAGIEPLGPWTKIFKVKLFQLYWNKTNFKLFC